MSAAYYGNTYKGACLPALTRSDPETTAADTTLSLKESLKEIALQAR